MGQLRIDSYQWRWQKPSTLQYSSEPGANWGQGEEGKASYPACARCYQQPMPQVLPTYTALREGERHAQGHTAKLLLQKKGHLSLVECRLWGQTTKVQILAVATSKLGDLGQEI